LAGIYVAEGNTLKILYTPVTLRRGQETTSDRPTSFTSPPSGAYLFTLTRSK
jgi:hypothetical protein